MKQGGIHEADGMILKMEKKADGRITYIPNPSPAALSRDSKFLKKYLLVDAIVFGDMIDVLLDHSYVRFGTLLRKQKVGIPMGTQCGPMLANWFAFYYEYKYISQLSDIITSTRRDIKQITEQPTYDETDVAQWLQVADMEQKQVHAFRQLKAMTFYGRFIDDVLNVNYVDFQLIINAFPPCLVFTTAVRSHTAVPFLDALIHQAPPPSRHLVVSLQDKRRDEMFTHIDIKQYTHWWSFLPRQIILNIGVGQYHRFRRVLTDMRSFIQEVAIMLAKLVSRCGIPYVLLWPRIRRLLFAPDTRYVHGVRPRRPAWIAGRIRALVRAALRSAAHLKRLINSTKQRRLQLH